MATTTATVSISCDITDSTINVTNTAELHTAGTTTGLNTMTSVTKVLASTNQVDLITTGRAKHPMIGVTLSSNIVQKNDFLSQRENGPIIKYLMPNGPAEKGGLKVNDLIISINDEILRS